MIRALAANGVPKAVIPQPVTMAKPSPSTAPGGHAGPRIPPIRVPVRIGLAPPSPAMKKLQGTSAASTGHAQPGKPISPATCPSTTALITEPIKAEPPTIASSLLTLAIVGGRGARPPDQDSAQPMMTAARQLRVTERA